MTSYHEIESTGALAEALKSSEQSPVLFFKHSNTCGISNRAFNEFQKYLETPESAQVQNYLIIIQQARRASDELANLVGVEHESPQAILVKSGRAVWNNSHMALKSGALIDAVLGVALNQ